MIQHWLPIIALAIAGIYVIAFSLLIISDKPVPKPEFRRKTTGERGTIGQQNITQENTMKKMFAVLVVLVGFLTLGSHVQAQDKPAWGTTAFFTHACQAWQRIESFEDANGDTSHFTTTEWMEDMQCIAYLSGYAEGFVDTSFVADGVVYNVFTPNGWTNKQLVQVFMAYVAAHPDTSTQPAGETLTSAMGAAGFIQKRTIGKLVPLPSKNPTNASPSNQQTAQNKR